MIEQAGIDRETMVLMAAVASDEILDIARKIHCDLIVMATRGRMGLIDHVQQEHDPASDPEVACSIIDLHVSA